MLIEDELHNACSESFQLIDTLDYKAVNYVIFNIDSIEEFMMLAKSLDAKQVYFKYRYYFPDIFLFFEEEYDEYPDNIENEVKKISYLECKLFYKEYSVL